jgi:hypothetical protein
MDDESDDESSGREDRRKDGKEEGSRSGPLARGSIVRRAVDADLLFDFEDRVTQTSIDFVQEILRRKLIEAPVIGGALCAIAFDELEETPAQIEEAVVVVHSLNTALLL